MSSPEPVPRWNIANQLTVLRILLVPIFGVVLMADSGTNEALRWAATGIFLVAVATDRIDGELARSRGLVTDLGKLLDPVADKLLIGTALILLAVLGDIPWWIPAVIVTREVGITWWRLAVAKKRVIPADRAGKLKTVLQSIAIGMFLWPLSELPPIVRDIAWMFMIAAVIMTLVSAIHYFHSAYRKPTVSPRAEQAESAAGLESTGGPKPTMDLADHTQPTDQV